MERSGRPRGHFGGDFEGEGEEEGKGEPEVDWDELGYTSEEMKEAPSTLHGETTKAPECVKATYRNIEFRVIVEGKTRREARAGSTEKNLCRALMRLILSAAVNSSSCLRIVLYTCTPGTVSSLIGGGLRRYNSVRIIKRESDLVSTTRLGIRFRLFDVDVTVIPRRICANSFRGLDLEGIFGSYTPVGRRWKREASLEPTQKADMDVSVQKITCFVGLSADDWKRYIMPHVALAEQWTRAICINVMFVQGVSNVGFFTKSEIGFCRDMGILFFGDRMPEAPAGTIEAETKCDEMDLDERISPPDSRFQIRTPVGESRKYRPLKTKARDPMIL